MTPAAARLSARGNVVLTGAWPTADLTATLNNFRILGRDDAVLTGSGNVAIAGSVVVARKSPRN